MKEKTLFFILAFLIIAITSCTRDLQNELVGTWKAKSLMEEDSLLSIDLKEVYFSFDEQGVYNFNSTLNYREAGTYERSGTTLFTTDTLKGSSKRKAVRILNIEKNILRLEMKDNGKRRILELVKDSTSIDFILK